MNVFVGIGLIMMLENAKGKVLPGKAGDIRKLVA